jgi:hypothetical protein
VSPHGAVRLEDHYKDTDAVVHLWSASHAPMQPPLSNTSPLSSLNSQLALLAWQNTVKIYSHSTFPDVNRIKHPLHPPSLLEFFPKSHVNIRVEFVFVKALLVRAVLVHPTSVNAHCRSCATQLDHMCGTPRTTNAPAHNVRHAHPNFARLAARSIVTHHIP